MHTSISPPLTSPHCASSWFSPSMGTPDAPGAFHDTRWADGGIPVTNSSFCFNWERVHDGVMRRSDDVDGEVTRMGMSGVGVKDVILRMKVVKLGCIG